MEKLIWEYVKEQGLIKTGQTVGVAVSGGPDSMALLGCLHSLAKGYQFSVSCIHFEHGIRGEESLRDADFVADYCDSKSILFYMGAADVPALCREWGVGEESAAKRAREHYFTELVLRGEVDCVATAHHMDDNAESVLMHILRGSGLGGLRGIHSRFGVLIRPMLCVTRAQIMQYLEDAGIPYRQDSSNKDNRFTRNYIRNVLLPGVEKSVNADVKAALNRLSSIAGEDADCLDGIAAEAYRKCAVKQDDWVLIDAALLNGCHAAVAARVIRLACAALHLIQDVERAHVSAVLRLCAANKTGTRVNLAHRLCAEMEYGTLRIGFAGRERDDSFEQRFDLEGDNVLPDGSTITCMYVKERTLYSMDGFRECLDADKLPRKMVVRTRHAGDVIHPLHCEGSKKLKEYFIDKKLPREMRDKTPLLADGNQIIWAVGHVISEDYCVDGHTKRVIQLEYKAKKREDME